MLLVSCLQAVVFTSLLASPTLAHSLSKVVASVLSLFFPDRSGNKVQYRLAVFLHVG